MRKSTVLLAVLGWCVWSAAATNVSQWGITWTFDKDYPSGQFANGDYWVVGPVRIVGISTDLHAEGFEPKPGEDGSMINPGTDSKQGYDSRLSSYDASLNAGLVNGRPVAKDNPLDVAPGSSLVSMVSWLYRSPEDAEPGTPKFSGGAGTPRPATRTAAVLTVLAEAPAANAFRPPYCGTDKSIKFTTDRLDANKLPKLEPVAGAPNVEAMVKRVERPWIDHVYEWMGAMIHPSENMPNYGRDLAQTTGDAILLLMLDFDKLPGNPTKDRLLTCIVQYGIDLAGIADNGGGWPANGGHHLGRKWPILFAGAMLDDEHMKNVGQWKTRFHEDEQTFFVSQAEIDVTNSPQWNPDKRSSEGLIPYTAEDIGLPEWGIRHRMSPREDNKAWTATYRGVNGPVFPSFALGARLMGLEEAWNHKPFFAYTDRWMERTDDGQNQRVSFSVRMWRAYNPAK